jgi:hypothetical protein
MFVAPTTHAEKTLPAKSEGEPYAYWGVILQSHYNEEFRQTYDFSYQGVLVNGIRHDSPAELSRIQPCDEIIAVNGQVFDDTNALIRFVHQQPANSYFRVTLLRNSQRLTVDSFIRWFEPDKGDAKQLKDNFLDPFAVDRCDLSLHRLTDTETLVISE